MDFTVSTDAQDWTDGRLHDGYVTVIWRLRDGYFTVSTDAQDWTDGRPHDGYVTVT